ncbi:MAG: MBL fold metallo-hydrolase [Opitutales bacterium]|nr:MBL fold metallo-hydrolase [Opitutales bacterium]NRA25673.1 MBL fold metallo-hydrolase [Opitutales bacterium]
MRFTDLNGQGGIGANASLIEIGPYTLLIDSGIHPKFSGNAALPDLEKIRDRDVDFILLTHCHLDHVGSIPVAARHFPRARILSSRANCLLGPRMLRNSINVMKRQKEEQDIPEYPFYSFPEVEALEDRMEPLAFHRTYIFDDRGTDLEITLYPAGHVAGAAGMRITCNGESVFTTGDCLFRDLLILGGAEFPVDPVDVIITETTRGMNEATASADRTEEWERLFAETRKTFERGGTVLIPTFALGRMQEVMTQLDARKDEPWLTDIPIYATGLGMDLVNYFDQISKRIGNLVFSRKVLKRLKVRTPDWKWCRGKQPGQPSLLLLSSGMLVENTPSWRAASGILDKPQNSIFFIGYCDPDTAGGQLQRQHAEEPEKPFFFEPLEYECPIRAEIQKFDLSGHAERLEIANYVTEVAPSTVILTHGEAGARDWFSAHFKQHLVDSTIIDPAPGETIEIQKT